MTRWPLWLGSLMCAATWSSAFAADTAVPFELPPLMQPAVSVQHPGKMIWAELTTNDLAGAKRFYGGLFGWTFADIHAGVQEYAVAMLDGAPIAGLVQPTPSPTAHQQPAWLTFLSVPSVRAVSQKIVTNGGKMLEPPRRYRQRGGQAVYSDPQGAVFAILHSTSGDPPDVLAAPGEWIWSALLTRDPGKEAAFYQNVFGYEVFELAKDGGAQHLVLSAENFARGIINELPDAAGAQHPHWINFIRVANVPAAAAKATALGGRVLVAPHLGRHGGMIALIGDPAGAPFGVMEWNDSNNPEAAK